MKTQLIKSEDEKVFKPFKAVIEIETIEDARLLYLLSNHLRTDLYDAIADEVSNQGFKL